MESEEKTLQKLDECADGKVIEAASDDEDTPDAAIVGRAIAYLKANPLDYKGCADHLDISFYLMRKLRKEYREEFENEEERYFSQLEKLVALDALGRELPPGYEGFEFSKAMKVLERRKREWAASQKQLAPEAEKLDVSYKELLKTHIEKEFGSGLKKPVRTGNA